MNLFHMEQTKFTPEVFLDPEKMEMKFIGKSYPENAFEFYMPILDWIHEFFQKKNHETIKVNFEIVYFNSSSSKVFFDIFDLFEEAQADGSHIVINWIYDSDNDTAEEAGEDFRDDFENLTINLIGK
ncbi:protein of unknown function (DUF1987) [Thiovulum sp. ES]|nr:protein of unknown function (DUF1987) [Thiovulum sp. ES]